jgi:hypothetical protein
MSTYISFGYLSRYTDYDEGTDSVRLASFVINTASDYSQDLNINTALGENSVDYTLSVSNNKNGVITEVATNYDIVIQSEDEFPDGISIQLNGITKESKDNENKNKFVFSNVGSFSSGVASTNTHVITFIADTEEITEDINMENININVVAKQLGGDSN